MFGLVTAVRATLAHLPANDFRRAMRLQAGCNTHHERIPAGAFLLSIQCSRGHYCEPRRDGLSLDCYSEFEVGVFHANGTWATVAELTTLGVPDPVRFNGLGNASTAGLTYASTASVQALYDFLRSL